ncbi:ATP-binding protein [Ramlibacter sp. RBP-2]|uniref:ATP-binding protein n=1 Tax=Ramlibacter lithotrophicus TaxID=2606681 RepID=A0A7X6I5Y9_9BURK|nr:AAA family ATPase [Ramlibacter lithotrophicus]NKE65574.1 ATP-binding protein [Ramlibacter lithotrophicus]
MPSPELTGGAGFTFEDAVAGCYLAALVSGTTAPGLDAGVVQRVAQQQGDAGEPLDDVIVDAVASADHTTMRLSLQVKRSLTVSDAASNTDFREVIQRSWRTLQKPDFREHLDRVGAAVGTMSDDAHRQFTTVCEWARASESPASFFQRCSDGGGASQAHQAVVHAVRHCALGDAGPLQDDALHRLLSHLVLIKFDLMHAGSTTAAAVLAGLQRALAPAQHARAQDLWDHLRQIARDGAGRREEFSRASLLRRLPAGYRFAGAPALAADLQVLRESSRHWLAQQAHDIGGTHVDRTDLRAALATEMERHRLTLIKGLPGTGKTVLLRDLLERCSADGTTLFLTANRLSGRSWGENAVAMGLSTVAIEPLLVEVAATGQAVLFIDGLDRIAPQQRAVVTDLLGQILGSPALASWRIVATARDAGIEPLRNWVPPALIADSGVGYVDVQDLSDGEAAGLVARLPALRPLLIGGDDRVRALARRPFFASVLARGLAGYPAGFAPRSELDLVRAWWARGGYDAPDIQVLARQQALIELAQRSARELGRDVRIRMLSPATQAVLPSLQQDGLVQQVRSGLTVQFAHDIFFEWSLLHLLLDEGEHWIRVLTDAGEPPALARTVELLSQDTYVDPEAWGRHLKALEAPALRPQWLRAWLIAPVFTPDFSGHADVLTATLAADDHRLLGKLLVWMRAEKTTPNPLVLSGQLGGDLAPAERIRIADLLGWPSDFGAWERLLTWALDHIDDIPDACLRELVALFQTWQVPLMDLPHPLSRRIVAQCATWLHAIEDAHQSPQWRSADDAEPAQLAPRVPGGLDSELRAIVLRAARAFPDVVRAYLVKIEPIQRLQESAFREVMGHAALLAQTHPELLAQVARRSFLNELPDDQQARERRESRERASRIAALRAKPEAERTRNEQRALDLLPMSIMSGRSFSHHDWDRLSIGADFQGYFPASPLREPFHALLAHAPVVGRTLVRDLANHAVLAWRQLHRHSGRGGTPLPLVLEFPWGRQEFWGAPQHYTWSRGHGGPHALECAMMALEQSALQQLAAGRPAGELLRELVEGHSSLAVLSIAVLVALRAQEVSAVSLPLVSSHRLWRLDLDRNRQERQLQSANLIGFTSDDAHRKAVIEAGGIQERGLDIRWLVQLFALGPDEGLRSACRAALDRFPLELDLDYDEPAPSEAQLAELRRNAELWAEFGHQENYVRVPIPGRTDVVGIEMRSARHAAPEILAARQHYEEIARESELWLWVEKCFETGALAPGLAAAEAVERAKEMSAAVAAGTAASLMPDHAVAHACIAGTAAAVLCFDGPAEHAGWARSTVEVYRDQVEAPADDLFAKSRNPWHPKLFVARALAASIRNGREQADDRAALYRLLAHPQEAVALKALEGIAGCWARDARFAWCGFNLGLRLAQYRRTTADHRLTAADRARIEDERRRLALCEAMRELAAPEEFPPWVQPLPSWTPVAPEADDELRQPDESGWRRSEDIWLSDFAAAVLQRVPATAVMQSPARDRYLEALEGFVAWTLDSVNPLWRAEGRQRRAWNGGELFHWLRQLGRSLAGVAERLPASEFRERLLGPILDQPDEVAMRLLGPLTGDLAASGVLDAPCLDPEVLGVLEMVLDRVLDHRDFRRSAYSDGSMSGYDMPDLIKAFLWVAIDGAHAATRFANGRWDDLPQMLPLVDKLVRQGGWIPYVATQYVTLCERAGSAYPVETFADQVLTQLRDGRLPEGWRGTAIPAALAGLVQAHAARHQPLPTELARKLLHVLDALVDLGDRRSAALQQMEAFRGVRLPPREGIGGSADYPHHG